MIIPFSMANLLKSADRLRICGYLVLLIAQVLCLYLTLARASWLATTIGSSLFFFLLVYRTMKPKLVVSMLIVLGLATIVVVGIGKGWNLPDNGWPQLNIQEILISKHSGKNQ